VPKPAALTGPRGRPPGRRNRLEQGLLCRCADPSPGVAGVATIRHDLPFSAPFSKLRGRRMPSCAWRGV